MAVVEALVNCVIFNDKTHAAFAGDKATRAERTITLRHGEKMLFGEDNRKGLVFENMRLKVVTVGEEGYTIDDVLTHDAHTPDTTLHSMLAAMKYPDYPVAVGVSATSRTTIFTTKRWPSRSRKFRRRRRSAAWTICCARARRGRYDNAARRALRIPVGAFSDGNFL